MKNAFRLFFTLFCILTIPSAPARAAGVVVWDFTTYTQKVILEKTTTTFKATDGNTEMVYVGGDDCAIGQGKNNAYCLKMGGATSQNTRTFVLRVTGTGTLSIETNGDNVGTWTGWEGASTGTQLFTDYKGYDGTAASPVITSTSEITVTGSLYLETSKKAYISKITWTPSESTGDYYSFHYGKEGGNYTELKFHQVETTTEWRIYNFILPDENNNQVYYVGKNGYWYNDKLGQNNSKSAKLSLSNMPLANLQNSGCTNKVIGWEYQNNSKNGHKAIGTLRIYDDSSDPNLYVGFIPNGYGLMHGVEGSSWGSLSFTYVSDHKWITDVVTLTEAMKGNTYKYYVGLLTSEGDYTFFGNSEKQAMNTMGSYFTGDWHKTLGNYPIGQKGVFRIWDNSCNNNSTKNFVCHFVPYYSVLFNTNGGTCSPTFADCSCEETTNITLPTPTREGYIFKGWYKDATKVGDAGNTYAVTNPSSDVTLTAQWEKVYTVTYNLNGGSGDVPIQEARPEGGTFTIASAEGITKEGYTFAGWSDGTTTYQPNEIYTISTADVILMAQWKTKWTLRGTFESNDATGWGTDHDFVATEEEGIATYTISLAANKPYEFKVYGGAKWYGLSGNEIYTGTFHCDLKSINLTNDNVKFTTTIAGNYIFTLDTKSDATYPTISVTYPNPCVAIFNASITSSANNMTASVGKVVVDGGQASDNYLKLSSNAKTITLTADGNYAPFVEGDVLYVTCYNKSSGERSRGVTIGSTSHTVSIAATSEGVLEYTLTAGDIKANGTVELKRSDADDRYKSIYVKRCNVLPKASTPTIALTAGCDEGSNMRKTFCTADANYASDFATWKNAGGWTATATVAGMQANEKCTIQWITQGTSNVVKKETFTYSQGTTSNGQTTFSSQYAPEGAGAYVVYATVSADGKTSAAANTTAQLRLQSPPDAPTLSANASDGNTIAQGTTITFTADASVSAFRWEQSTDGGTNWTTITGATSSIYEWTTGELTAGTYSFRVIATNSNVSGCNESVPSNTLSFTVQTIAEHVPLLSVSNDKSCAKDGGATITASHITKGSTLAWYKDGILISGETGESITVKESGNYHAVATYSGTEYASEPVAVTVYAAATITANLDAQYTVAAGKSVTLSVGMTGAVSYQWYTCSDASGSNPVKVSNATTRQLNISVPLGTTEGTEYYYYVEGIGECGGSVESKVATVEVIALSYETCISGSTNYYDFLELTANPWSDSDNAFKLAGESSSLTIKAADGYYITKVEFDIFSSLKESSSTTETHAFVYQWGTDKANARTYETEVGKTPQTFTLSNADRGNKQLTLARNISTDGTNIVGEASKTRYITRCCVTVAPLCTAPTMSYDNPSVSRPYSTTAETPQSLSITNGLTATYTSSNPDIAEVDEETGEITYRAIGSTTISAYTAGDATYCEAAASYTLTVTKPDGSADFPASLSPTTATLNCGNNAKLTATPAGAASYQWYKDGVLLSGATASTYDATAVGIYRVLITANGYAQWSNTATVSNSGTAAPIVTRLTPFHYYRDKCNYTSGNDNPLRHLFNVVSRGTDSEKKPWEITVWKTSKDGTDDREISNVSDWLYADPTDSRVVLMNLKNLAARGKSTNIVDAGDRLTITVRPLNGCNEYDADAAESIEVYVTDSATRAVAYIVSGGNGNTITYGGDFLTGYNPNDLLAMNGYTGGKTSWSTDPDPLWHVLDTCKTYIATAVNGYAPFNKYNYEPFDLVLLTDFPKTDKNVNGQTGAPYLNDLAELVDSKPFLTLKAHMAKNGMDKWKALGFKATPLVPTSTQLTLDLICSQHTIFDRVHDDIQVPNAMDADGQLQLLKAGGYDSGKGLQGFMARDMVGFMNIATIPYRNGSSDTLLVACCERQTNLDARLMVLSINAQAMSQLNTIGGNTLLSMLDYLLIDDYARVEDCGCIFDNNGGKGDGKWSTTTNWQNRKLPQRATTAHIHANCVVDQMDAVVGELKIWNEATLTINADAALQVSDRIGYCDKENRLRIYPISSASTIRIQADANGAGTLIHSASPDWEVPATVAYYSIASGAPTDCQWQWVTTPIHDMQGVEQYFYGAWLYEWSNEVHQWNKYLRNGDSMRPFNGYSLTQKTSGTTYTIAGNLVYAQDTTIALHYDNANKDGCNLIGNSWTAPINIAGFEESDFKNCEASIILFNTGLDPEGKGSVSGSKNNTTAGQYVSVPVNTASSLAKEIQVIPAMQTFQVNATGEGASVQLRYNNLVRTYSSEGINRQPMRVAARNDYEGEGITDKLHIRVDGERFSDHVYLFRNADCTYGFDNGWDGTKMLGDERAVQLFAEQGENQWAVSTQPSLAGTQLGFYRGEDDTYTMYFDYEGSEVLYLYDNETQRYTLVESGATYTFSSFTYDLEHRFLLTDYNPETPEGPTTGITHITVSGDQLSISHTGSEPLTISVYDAAGHTCLRLQADAPLTAIPLPDTQGVYLIEVQSASARITQKVVR